MKRVRIAHVLPTISREAGGPSVSVRRLVESLIELQPDAEWRVFAGDAAGGTAALGDWRHVRPQLFSEKGPARFGWAPGLRPAVTTYRPSLIHVHGLWRHHTWASGDVARALGVPLVISPRGMLEPWALRHGRVQKWLANRLFQRSLFRRAACVIATSDLEAHGTRAADVRAPLAVIPNGIDVPTPRGKAYSSGSVNHKYRTALFLSRIHPKKGVIDLLQAWIRVAPTGWRLKIVGPGEGDEVVKANAIVKEAGLTDTIEITGPVWGAAKQCLMADSHLFILPSYSENFGMVVGEALAAGLPVITTRATPWREIESERCGWWIETGVNPLAVALTAAVATSSPDLAAMGVRGANLVARRYSWPRVAADILELYRWANDKRGDMPHVYR